MATTIRATGLVRGRGWHWWRPRNLDWWTGAVLVPGALCFLLAPISPIADWVGLRTDLWAFFVGSVFFTTSGTLQLTGALRAPSTDRRADLWAAGIQLLGMLFFNISTYAATLTDQSVADEVQIVWKPDFWGSVCFLVSATIASFAVGAVHWPLHTRQRWTATVNLFGCIFFMVSALAAYILPDGDVVRVTTANRFTSFGAACFLICAIRAMADADLQVGITPKRVEKERAREAWVEEHLEHRPPDG